MINTTYHQTYTPSTSPTINFLLYVLLTFYTRILYKSCRLTDVQFIYCVYGGGNSLKAYFLSLLHFLYRCPKRSCKIIMKK